MFLDHNILTIIGRSFRWSVMETDAHIVHHYETINKLILMKTTSYIDRNLPEKKKELMEKLNLDENGKHTPHKTAEGTIKAFEVLNDQLKLVMASYPDLQRNIESTIFNIEKDLFLLYMRTGPTEGRLAVIDYIKKKISTLDRFPPAFNMVQTLIKDKEIREVLE